MRLPVESGTNRMRGFGYAEFDTINDLMEALSLNKEVVNNCSMYYSLFVVCFNTL